MAAHTNRVRIVVLGVIVLMTATGIIAGPYVASSYPIPLFALAMLLWTVMGRLISGWSAVMVGLAALLAAFAGIIGAYFPALLLAILASILVMDISFLRSPKPLSGGPYVRAP